MCTQASGVTLLPKTYSRANVWRLADVPRNTTNLNLTQYNFTKLGLTTINVTAVTETTPSSLAKVKAENTFFDRRY